MSGQFTCLGPLEQWMGWAPPSDMHPALRVSACYWHTAEVVQTAVFALMCVIVMAMILIAARTQ